MSDELNACKQLLYLATQAQAGKPSDKSIAPLSNENREFLEKALKEAANCSIRARDPVDQLKALMSQLKNNTLEHAELAELVEELVDLVCGIDLALDFCKLGGLEIIKKYMNPTASNEAIECSATPALFAGVLGVISQNNPAVQEQLLTQETSNHFLTHCLQTIVDENASEAYKVKCLGAISSMVRGYSPAFQELIRRNGLGSLRQCFDQAVNKKEERVVERLAIVVVNIALSFEGTSTVIDAEIVDLMKHVHNTLVDLQQLESNKYSTAIEYIRSHENIMEHIVD